MSRSSLLFEAITYGLFHLGRFEAEDGIVGTDSLPLSASTSIKLPLAGRSNGTVLVDNHQLGVQPCSLSMLL